MRRRFGDVEVRGLFGSERYMELFDEERAQARPAAAAATRCGCAARVPERAAPARSTTCCCAATAAPTIRARAAIAPDDFHLRDDDLDAALDLVRDLLARPGRR